ncbi:DUF2471 family protein [Paraburkholderia xenovorans]|uniref:DUF2471 family protein n=1 Tax=Paraburkholderia xenovorans TaxID=36873 RepID=UPI0015583B7E|nr:DUF2471 family protein [Paraburkholderia xenovorans]NPT39175.1 DUF2471 family protein [Paraburkholderia xenovorans]
MSDFAEALDRAEDAIREIVPVIVRRHRAAGTLTWRLMHQIEGELLQDLSASGRHNARLLGMLRSSGLMEYPKDDTEVSLEGHEAVPVVFSEVYKAWRRVD